MNYYLTESYSTYTDGIRKSYEYRAENNQGGYRFTCEGDKVTVFDYFDANGTKHDVLKSLQQSAEPKVAKDEPKVAKSVIDERIEKYTEAQIANEAALSEASSKKARKNILKKMSVYANILAELKKIKSIESNG